MNSNSSNLNWKNKGALSELKFRTVIPQAREQCWVATCDPSTSTKRTRDYPCLPKWITVWISLSCLKEGKHSSDEDSTHSTETREKIKTRGGGCNERMNDSSARQTHIFFHLIQLTSKDHSSWSFNNCISNFLAQDHLDRLRMPSHIYQISSVVPRNCLERQPHDSLQTKPNSLRLLSPEKKYWYLTFPNMTAGNSHNLPNPWLVLH